MKPSQIITLLTDFGTKDPYVGAMKGVILGINPKATIVDVSHEISSHNIAEAAFCMVGYIPYFPKGTIHLCVVDPGVGGERRAIAIKTKDFYLVGPDNGVFTLVVKRFGYDEAVVLENSEFFNSNISKTFHGRDIFAPVAAHLSVGLDIKVFGKAVRELQLLNIPEPRIEGKFLKGEIIHFDRFGNAITNIDDKLLRNFLKGATPQIIVKEEKILGLVDSYSAVPKKGLLAIIDSYGFLEIAANMASAKRLLKLKLGNKVLIRSI